MEAETTMSVRPTRCLWALLLLCAGATAQAPTLDLQAVVKSATLAQLKQLCHQAGYVAEDTKDDDGDPGLLVTMSGFKVAVILYGRDGRFGNLACQANFRAEALPSYEKVNDWNQQHRFSRAYLTPDRHRSTLEEDLDLAGGLTWQTLANFLKTFDESLAAYLKHIDFK